MDEEETRARTWEKARRVLQAAAVEAHGRPGAYVTQDRVMQQADMVDTEHFRTIAEYLEEQGWIDEADDRLGDQITKGYLGGFLAQRAVSAATPFPVRLLPRRFGGVSLG